MKYYEIKVLADLLEKASEEFSNHGCNDYDLREVLPQYSDRYLFEQKVNKENGSPEVFDEDVKSGSQFVWENDAGLFSYFATMLRHKLAGTRSILVGLLQAGIDAKYEEDKHRALSNIAHLFEYEFDMDAWRDAIKNVNPQDQFGRYLQIGLETRKSEEKQLYLKKIAEHEGIKLLKEQS